MRRRAGRVSAVANRDIRQTTVNPTGGATGPEIAEYLLRALDGPVLFVTGNPEALPEDLEGAFGALAKPISERSFLLALRYVAARLKGCGEAAAPPGLVLPPKRATRRGESDSSMS